MNRQICLRLVWAVLALAVLAVSSFAWLSSNDNVNSSGIAMDIETSGNLVISDNVTTLQSYTSASFDSNYVVKDWGNETTALIPADHYTNDDYPVVEGTDDGIGLVYNTNPVKVDKTTGKGTVTNGTSAELTFAHVPADGIDLYYIDYVVYIASLDKAWVKGTDFTKFTVSISENYTIENGSVTDKLGTSVNNAYKSASVDVYIDKTYAGTVNLADSSSFDFIPEGNIPVNTSGENVEVLLRCYFDGALTNPANSGNCFVNTNALTTGNADIFFTITISAN